MRLNPSVSPPHRSSFAPWILLVVALLALLPGNGRIPLVDRDEPRFAEATHEMMLRGEWIVPYFNDGYRFDKPVLIYWMMRPFYALFGVNEWTARMPSVLCAAALALALAAIGRRWFNARIGFAAGFGILTCFQMLIHGRSAVADLPMVLAVLLTQFALFELLQNPSTLRLPSSVFRLLLYVALGLGFLAKGPVAWIVPALTLIAYRLLARRPLPWKRLAPAWGLPLMLLIVGAWGIPALLKTGGAFWAVGMKSHVWDRGFETFQGHGGFFVYYLLTAFISLFPWIAFFGFAWQAVRTNWNQKQAFLVAWVAVTYLLFGFYATKLPHYVMPAFPAVFLLLAQGFDRRENEPRWARVWYRTVMTLFATLAALVGLVLLVTPIGGAYAGLRLMAWSGVCIVVALLALGVCRRNGKRAWSILPLIVLAAAVTGLGQGLREAHPALRVRGLIEEMPAGARFAFMDRLAEPSFVFYANAGVDRYDDLRVWEGLNTAEEASAFLNKPGPCLLVAAEREVKLEKYLLHQLDRRLGKDRPMKIRDYTDRLPLGSFDDVEVVTEEGANIARTSGIRFRVYRRR